MKRKYKHIALGGTFDLLHLGHIDFLKKSFSISEFVTVGIVSDIYANALRKKSFETFWERKRNVQKLLKDEGFDRRFSIVSLHDIFGTTPKDSSIEAVIGTENTKSGGILLSNKRLDLGMDALDIVILPLKLADDGVPISTSRIKDGFISRSGLNYFEYLRRRDFLLPRDLRKTLRKPFGEIVKNITTCRDLSNLPFYTVGDQTTANFVAEGHFPSIAIVDFHIQRSKRYNSIRDLGIVDPINIGRAINRAGEVSKNLSCVIYKSLQSPDRRKIILVRGEEDLAVLPLALMAPLNSSIYYGIREKGLVELKVSEDLKVKLLSLLIKFQQK